MKIVLELRKKHEPESLDIIWFIFDYKVVGLLNDLQAFIGATLRPKEDDSIHGHRVVHGISVCADDKWKGRPGVTIGCNLNCFVERYQPIELLTV